MFDRLIDLLVAFWQSLMPFVVCKPWEAGIILRLGKINRQAKKGFNWLIPMVEESVTIDTQVRTNWTASQTLITADNQTVTVRFVIVWDVVDAEKAITNPDDISDAIRDTYIGLAGDIIAETSFEDLNKRRFITKLKRECQKKAAVYGVRIIDINLAEFTACKTLRLIQDT